MATTIPDWSLLWSKWQECWRRHPNIPMRKSSLTRAVAIREKASGADSPELVPDLSQLARVNVAKHNLPASEGLYQRVLKIQQMKLSPNSPELLPTLDALAALTLEQNTRRGAAAEADAVHPRRQPGTEPC